MGCVMGVNLSELTSGVIGACIEVHRELGAGLLESTYEGCLCHELSNRGIHFARQKALPVVYKGERIDCGYFIDVLVEDVLVLELKSVEAVLPVHKAQLLTYLKLGNLPVGLLINFNVVRLTNGITRLVNQYKE